MSIDAKKEKKGAKNPRDFIEKIDGENSNTGSGCKFCIDTDLKGVTKNALFT